MALLTIRLMSNIHQSGCAGNRVGAFAAGGVKYHSHPPRRSCAGFSICAQTRGVNARMIRAIASGILIGVSGLLAPPNESGVIAALNPGA